MSEIGSEEALEDITDDIDNEGEEDLIDTVDTVDSQTNDNQGITSRITSSKSYSDNKFYPILMNNLTYGSKFLFHSIIMHRVNSFFNGAEPLVEDTKREEISSETSSYEEIFKHLVSLALKEVKEGKSPMVYYDNLFQEYRSANYLNKDLFEEVIKESQNLSED